MRALSLAAIVLVGCGRLGYVETPSAAMRDGGVVDASSSDAASADGGVSDAGSLDGGVVDAGERDAGERDAGDADAAPSDGGLLDLPCGTTIVLSDDFEDGVVAPDWLLFENPGMTVAEETGHVHVRFAATVEPGIYAGYQTTALRDLSAACMTVELAALPDPATEALTYVKIIAGVRELEIVAVAGFLSVRTQEGGVVTPITSIPHDAEAHRHWRIREAGGNIRWETSADGVTFVNLATTVESTSLASAMIAFGAGAYVPTADAGDAQFESITVTSR